MNICTVKHVPGVLLLGQPGDEVGEALLVHVLDIQHNIAHQQMSSLSNVTK